MPAGNPRSPSGIFGLPPENAETAEGPFAEYLTQAKRPEQQQQSGWGGKPAFIMNIADSFLRGAQQGRVAAFMRSENEKLKQRTEFRNNVEHMMANPNLTQAGRDAIWNKYLEATGAHVSVAADGSGESGGGGKGGGKGKGGGNPLLSIFKEIGAGMTGGKMPKGAKDLTHPDQVLGEITRISNDPQYQSKAQLEALAGQAREALSQAKPEWQQDAIHAIGPILQKMRSIDPAEAERFAQDQLAPYDVRPARGSDAWMRIEAMRPPPAGAGTGQQPQPPATPERVDEFGRSVTPAGVAGPPSTPQQMASGPPRQDQFGRPVVPGNSVLPPAPRAETQPGPKFSDEVLAARRGAFSSMKGYLSPPRGVSYTDASGKKQEAFAQLVNDPQAGQYWVGPDGKAIRSPDIKPISRPAPGSFHAVKDVTGPDGKPSTLLISPDGKREYFSESKMAQLSAGMRTQFEATKAAHPGISDEEAMEQAGKAILKKNEGMDPATAQFMAGLFLTGGPSAAPLGFGSPQTRAMVFKEVAAIAKRLDLEPNDVVAGWATANAEKSTLSKLTNISTFVDAYGQFVKSQQKRWDKASDDLERTDYAAFNTPLNKLRQQANDPNGKVAAYLLLVNQIQVEFAKVTQNPASTSSPPVRAQAEMDKVVNGSATPAQVKSMMKVMDAEVEDKKRSYKDEKQALRKRIKFAAFGGVDPDEGKAGAMGIDPDVILGNKPAPAAGPPTVGPAASGGGKPNPFAVGR